MPWFAKSTEMYTLKRPCRCYVFCVVTLGLSTSERSAAAFHIYSCLCPSGKFTLDNSVLNTASTTVTTYMAQNIQGFDTCARLRLLGFLTRCLQPLEIFSIFYSFWPPIIPTVFQKLCASFSLLHFKKRGGVYLQALGRDRIIQHRPGLHDALCVGSLLLDRIVLFRQSQRGI